MQAVTVVLTNCSGCLCVSSYKFRKIKENVHVYTGVCMYVPIKMLSVWDWKVRKQKDSKLDFLFFSVSRLFWPANWPVVDPTP